ncbi:hypothetical protein BGZ63DRAFT_433328 [Mariannaea sp. PMI_226]|nr:hypothetical protein BGZ63DRAFT_433328 [Mariannaea sp. PMI_226]
MMFPSFSHFPLSIRVWLLQELVFHIFGLACEWCDRKGALQQFKVKAKDRKSYTQILPRIFFNQVTILLPCMVLTEVLGWCFCGGSQLPPARFLVSLPAMAIGHDVIQYATHRYLLHLPYVPLMRALRHSVHHTTTASRGISACYMSAPDFFLEIVLPYLIPLSLIGGGQADLLFHSAIAGLGAVGGIYEHSGYDFSVKLRHQGAITHWWPGIIGQLLSYFLDNRSHSEHHSRGSVSFSDGFGSPGICDTIFGTRWDLVDKHRQAAEAEWQARRRELGATEKS